MSKTILLNQNWIFSKEGHDEPVTLPHTWNAIDGQDGGNDYWRGTCTYSTTFAAPAFDAASQEVWLQFEGVNSSAKVLLNGRNICTHDGGYSTFRVHVSDLLEKDNQLTVEVDNSITHSGKAQYVFELVSSDGSSWKYRERKSWIDARVEAGEQPYATVIDACRSEGAEIGIVVYPHSGTIIEAWKTN